MMLFKVIPLALSKFHKWLVKRLHFSITFKITTMYALIFTFVLLLFNTGICAATMAYLGVDAAEELDKNYQIVTSYLTESTEIPSENIEYLAKLEQVEITLFNENQKVLYTTGGNTIPAFYDQTNHVNFEGKYFLSFNRNYLPSNHFYTAIPYQTGLAIVLQDTMFWNSNNIHIQITHHLLKETISVGVLVSVLFTLTVVAIMIVIIIGWRTSKRMLKPVEVMTKTVKNITVNALDTRLDVTGSQDELKELAETFNSMLDRIQFSYEQQKQFVSDASHELRTPIAVIQGYANLLDRWGKNDQSILEESIGSIKTEAINMQELVEKLLFLARGDKNSQKLDKKAFSLQELIDEVSKESKLIAQDHEFISERCEDIVIQADRKLLKEAMRVFIDNSIKYTPKGGKIIINCYSQNDKAVLTVEDSGIGIAQEDLPHIFNRFYRADKSRTKQTGGTGLGLAIAKRIIQMHGGNIEVTSKMNEGTKIRISLPK